jgi:hypothetical protein
MGKYTASETIDVDTQIYAGEQDRYPCWFKVHPYLGTKHVEMSSVRKEDCGITYAVLDA